ncbi:MAG: GAF domain-containing sensor histidine kinase [Actinomycetota bacterium]
MPARDQPGGPPAASGGPPEDVLVRSVGTALELDAVALVDGDGTVAALWTDGRVPRARDVVRAAARLDATAAPAVGTVRGHTVVAAPADGEEEPAATLVGVLPAGRVIGPAEERTFAAFARVAGIARASRMERERARRTQDRMASLVDAGMVIAAGHDLRDVLERLADASREVIGSRYAALGVLNEERTALSDFLWSGLSDEEAARVGPLPQGRGILGALIRDARPLRLSRIHDDPRSVGVPAGHPPMRTFLGVPVTLGAEVIGNLYLTDKLGGEPFTEEDEQIALTLAAQAAIAVDNARRLEAELRRVAELESVQEVAAAMLRTLDLDTLLPLVARRARRLSGADLVAVGLLERGDLVIHFADGEGASAVEGMRFDADSERGIAAELAAEVGATDCEFAWLVIGGHRVGALAACGPRPFDDAARRLLDTFSSQAAIALSNARTFADERRRLLASAEIVAAHARERAAEEGLRRAIAAQEAERARVARELHDETGQVLTALAVQLRALEDHVADVEGRERMAELRQLVSGAAVSVRSLATELRPSGLQEHGLAAAIGRHADRVREATGIPVDLAIDDLPTGLADEVQIAIFRVVQESLTNVARHSGAARASVLATQHRGRMRVVVEDDGCGFDPEEPTGRLGIVGMRERMELVGGEIRVESSPGEGTAVIIELEVPG